MFICVPAISQTCDAVIVQREESAIDMSTLRTGQPTTTVALSNESGTGPLEMPQAEGNAMALPHPRPRDPLANVGGRLVGLYAGLSLHTAFQPIADSRSPSVLLPAYNSGPRRKSSGNRQRCCSCIHGRRSSTPPRNAKNQRPQSLLPSVRRCDCLCACVTEYEKNN